MIKSVHISALVILIQSTFCEGQAQVGLPKDMLFETKELIASNIPKTITRNFIQDSKGNIWVAAFDGIFRYDAQSFVNITSKVSSAHFFDVLEDRTGNFWFASVGSGVFYYDPRREVGKTIQNFTTKDGLASDIVLDIYEDKTGKIWFGSNGASRFDPARRSDSATRRSDSLGESGKFFTNYKMNEGLSGIDLYDNAVNSIVEDDTGKFWFGTLSGVYRYNGKAITALNKEGQ
jgi:ligand-binding sensor domain-containing protein